MKTTYIAKSQVLKLLPTKIKTYTVISSPNCQLLSTPFCPHLLHAPQISFTRSFSGVRPMYLHYHQYKTKNIRVYFKKNVFVNASKSLILFRYCPHPLCSLILHNHSAPLAHSPIHSAPLSHSPHPLHPLIDHIRQRRKKALLISSTLTVPVFKFKFLHNAPHQKRQICVCYVVFFAHENKNYSEIYVWTSSLLLSEVSILALPSHSCLHVQELHTTHTDRQTHRHTHTHTNTHTTCILEKWLPLQGERAHSLYFWSFQNQSKQ